MSKIAMREGLLTGEIEGKLVGLRCKACGHILPPLTMVCTNCYKEDLEKVALSERGTLYSYTIVYQPHERFETPYAVGYVDLPEGLRLFSHLKMKEGKPLKVGMDVKLVTEKLWEENGNEIIGPKFQPL